MPHVDAIGPTESECSDHCQSPERLMSMQLPCSENSPTVRQ
uniref:Uncharacterized protein n=1 Tax=Rhizophora mucronata TaxID=61149 RepID=A0A2P2PIF2_RHIMU